MKKIALLFVFIAGLTKAQTPQLSVTGYGYYTDSSTASPAPYLTFFGLNVYNADTTAFYDSLYLVMAVEYPVGVINIMSEYNCGLYSIPGLSTVTVDTAYFTVDTSLLKDGNNTVVIWPFGQSNPGSTTADSLYTTVFIVNAGIHEIASQVPIKFGPNPSTNNIVLQDPENILQSVKISTLDGKRIPVSVNEKTIDLSKLPEGIYLMEITTSKGIISKKLMIHH